LGEHELVVMWFAVPASGGETAVICPGCLTDLDRAYVEEHETPYERLVRRGLGGEGRP
jgi:hypothetical protein